MVRKTLRQRIEELEAAVGVRREIIILFESLEVPGKYKETVSGKFMTIETARKRYPHPYQILLIVKYKRMKTVEGECTTNSTQITEKAS